MNKNNVYHYTTQVYIQSQTRRGKKKPECTFQELYQLYECDLYFRSHELGLHEDTVGISKGLYL